MKEYHELVPGSVSCIETSKLLTSPHIICLQKIYRVIDVYIHQVLGPAVTSFYGKIFLKMSGASIDCVGTGKPNPDISGLEV